MELIKFLATIGGATILAVIFGIITLLLEVIKDKIRDSKWKYKREHRFDKPPTAACYCKDCKFYEVRNGYGRCRCGHINQNWDIVDSWFCWQAEPLERDPDRIKKAIDDLK